MKNCDVDCSIHPERVEQRRRGQRPRGPVPSIAEHTAGGHTRRQPRSQARPEGFSPEGSSRGNMCLHCTAGLDPVAQGAPNQGRLGQPLRVQPPVRQECREALRCSPHKLRHSHATALMNAGRTIDEVQEVLGHSSIATTRIYSHVNKRRLAATAASLPDVLD
ncbi:tyrosine-type recombinase/integrase [Deinococcus petrolearius]|uniref:Tyrosine-type recombinase/integrase n=1 Tax=Deinococcus petrolearius TaxID=1751295 RepID=A0ABW1DKS6_9DEIO